MQKRAIIIMGMCIVFSIFGKNVYAQEAHSQRINDYQEDVVKAVVSQADILEKEQTTTKLYHQVQNEMYEEFSGMYDENYAGSYLDEEKNLIIQFLDITNIPKSICDLVDNNESVMIKAAENSYHQLNTVYESISNAIATPETWGYEEVIGVELSIQDNVVIVRLKDCSQDKIQKFQEKIASHSCIQYQEGKMASSDNPFTIEIEKNISKGGLEYRIINDMENAHQVAVIGVNTNKRSISIPESILWKGQKYKVVSIGEESFTKNGNLRKIVIGKNICKIEKKAFYKCRNLNKIQIKSKKLKNKDIGSKAFYKVGSKNKKKLRVQVPSGMGNLSRKILRQAKYGI